LAWRFGPAAVDGGPHIVIKPGSTWRPVLKIDQPETTTWYHADPHYDTGRQVYMGLAGLIIVEDGTGEQLGLPHSYGVDDLPIIMQGRQVDRNGALLYGAFGPSRMLGIRGDTLIVNGAIASVGKVPPGLVRLRLLNAANARNFDLRFGDGRTFHVIASDGLAARYATILLSTSFNSSVRTSPICQLADGAFNGYSPWLKREEVWRPCARWPACLFFDRGQSQPTHIGPF
jgi:FtsP/CotA-like multicopper oxidase with cupredoxin domain